MTDDAARRQIEFLADPSRSDLGDESVMREAWRVDRPYRDMPAVEMADTLEYQYDAGEPFNPEMVFELLNRALVLEGDDPDDTD